VMHANGRSPGQRTRVVRDDDLAQLLREGRRGAREPIELDLAAVSGPDAARTAERLTELGADCGCSWGARAMFAGLGVSVVAMAAIDDVRSLDFVFHLPLALAAAVLCAVAGKALGLHTASRRYRREVEGLLLRATRPLKEA
jgi:hypothetical protein